ncbi:MAG: helicase HerA-like domain-containing protein [Ornithinimicrobium sp.]
MTATFAQRVLDWWVVSLVGVAATAAAVGYNVWNGDGILGLHYAGYRYGLISLVQLDPIGVVLGMCVTGLLGMPIGVMVGGVLVGVVTRSVGRPEWHPVEVRRVEMQEERRHRQAVARAGDLLAQAGLTAPPIGVALDASLTSWVSSGFVVLPAKSANLAMAIVGASGTGKTVTLQRIVMAHASAKRKVVLVDLKGTDPGHADAQIAAYRSFHPRATVMRWPDTPLDMWRGSTTEIANRLLTVHDFTEPFYEEVAHSVVRLALDAGDEPCRSSEDFLERLDLDYLKHAHSTGPHASDVRTLARRLDALDGVRLRYSGYFKALDGRFDGNVSFDDADLIVITVPAMAAKKDASAYVAMILADFGHYCSVRKPRSGHDVTLIIDEFSAVPTAAPFVIDLGERIRDVGGQVIVTAQSFQGLGSDDDERKRLVSASAGGLIIHGQQDPDELLKAAGTVRKSEQSWQLDSSGGSGMGSMRMGFRMAIDPDTVRQAGVGEAWVIASGRYVHMQVLPAPTAPPAKPDNATNRDEPRRIERRRHERPSDEPQDPFGE